MADTVWRPIWHIAYQVCTHPCGCAEWMQYERGQWVDKTWKCNRHEPQPA